METHHGYEGINMDKQSGYEGLKITGMKKYT
jgi:hypothetical protein